jgi:DNA mismatch repair protein MutS2
MDERSLKALEFFQVLEALKEFSVSPLGQRRCLTLRPSGHLPFIQSRLTEVLELKEVLEIHGDLPLQGLKDVEEILRKLDVEGSALTVSEILDLYHHLVLAKDLRRFFLKLGIDTFPHLQEKISRLSSLKALEKEILQAIHPKGEILDRASPKLSEVRDGMAKARERAKGVLEHLLHREELQPLFQEQLITLRNGRYVLLLKSEHKHQLEGIIHDQSQSGMTFFFEPLQVVTFNNEINILMGEEKEEEFRILADLSQKLRDEKESLWTDLEILGEMDLLYAMARLSIQLKGVHPLLNEEGKVDMRGAKHPLLLLQKEDRVIPVDLRMGDGIKVLIVSGANGGGKTVALKTLGLLTAMVQSGLPIPVLEGSQVAIFQGIFGLVGDEQNIAENLSTFSSHLLHLDQILSQAGPRSLVLLDELGVGTHASEGSALAMGFLDQLSERGASVVVTTHFDRLKLYGYLHPEVENVAVEFDEETLEPKYTLAYGASGMSNAFLVAEKLGISSKVVEKARHYLEGSEQEVAKTLVLLERLKADAEKERQGLLKMREEAGRERQRLKELLERIKSKRQEILSQAEGKGRKALQRLEEELKAWLEERKKEKVRLGLRSYRKEISDIKERFFPSVKSHGKLGGQGGLTLGEHVRIVSLGQEGVLMSLDGPLNEAEVMTEKARVKTFLSDLEKVTEGEKERGQERPGGPWRGEDAQEHPSQLNVIGLTVDDALPIVDKFIDQALVHGLEKVQIIHGVGSGRLRNAIGKFLHDHQGVKTYAPGDKMRGGNGITVVELR